jgi:hypothetical protein
MIDPNCFPVPETPESLIVYAIGNSVLVPLYAHTCLLRKGRVVKHTFGKPGGTMLVHIEEMPE